MTAKYPQTPGGRYFVAKSRLWRRSDPALDADARQVAVNDLMAVRRALGQAKTDDAKSTARREVDAAKRALGERGPVWCDDGAPDETRKHPKNTSYAAWWAGLDAADRARGAA